MCRARSAGHPVIRIPSRATGSAATAGTVSSCDAVRRAPGSAMSTACRDFTRRGRGPGRSGRTIAAARPGPHPDPGHLALRAETRRPCWCGLHGRGYGTLAALLGPLDHGGSNKPPLLTKSARPTFRQTSTAATIACASGSIELIGSSTFGPVVQAAASIYTRQCHARINVVYGDVGGKGIDSAYAAATVNAAVQSKPAQAGSMIAMYNGETSSARS